MSVQGGPFSDRYECGSIDFSRFKQLSFLGCHLYFCVCFRLVQQVARQLVASQLGSQLARTSGCILYVQGKHKVLVEKSRGRNFYFYLLSLGIFSKGFQGRLCYYLQDLGKLYFLGLLFGRSLGKKHLQGNYFLGLFIALQGKSISRENISRAPFSPLGKKHLQGKYFLGRLFRLQGKSVSRENFFQGAFFASRDKTSLGKNLQGRFFRLFPKTN